MSAPTERRRKFPLQLAELDRPFHQRQPCVDPKALVGTPLVESKGVCAPLLRPQQPLHQAAAEAARHSQPMGLGMDSAEIRKRMVDRLCELGLTQADVIAAMKAVPRHDFVDAALANQAYEDTSLPIGLGQTISKPSVVARMIELLMAGAQARISGSLGQTLEIGTGCGYQAAVLSRLSRQVISVERLKPMHDKAKQFLAPLRLTHIRLVYGDGLWGHPPNAPYQSIIAAAGGASIPPAWLEQLAVGGRLVAPVHDALPTRQVLVVIDRTQDGYVRSTHEPVNFVPLISGLT